MNTPMSVNVAKRPFANTAYNFAVIRPMPPFRVKVKPTISTRPQKATIWGLPAIGTLEKATKPCTAPRRT